MMNLRAVVGLLLMGAVAFAAPANAPTVAIDASSIEFDAVAFQMSFNVTLTGLGSGADGFSTTGDPLIDNTLGIDIGVRFGGPGAANLTLGASLNQKTSGSWATVIAGSPSPKAYLFEDFGVGSEDGIASSNSQVVATVDGDVLTHGMLDERTVLSPTPPTPPEVLGFVGVAPVVDTVVVRFIVWWDTTEVTAGNWLSIHLQAGSELPDPKFLTNAGGSGPIFANVDNNDLMIPEPATMSLLAIGLGALIARRRRSA
jgi:PEP-CTERM motif